MGYFYHVFGCHDSFSLLRFTQTLYTYSPDNVNATPSPERKNFVKSDANGNISETSPLYASQKRLTFPRRSGIISVVTAVQATPAKSVTVRAERKHKPNMQV